MKSERIGSALVPNTRKFPGLYHDPVCGVVVLAQNANTAHVVHTDCSDACPDDWELGESYGTIIERCTLLPSSTTIVLCN